MFSMLSKFTHKREMRESKDEILIGQVIAAMAKLSYPAIGFRADSGDQMIRFRPVNDDVLYAVVVKLDRKTGGSAISDAIMGSKAIIRLELEIKNFLADPDDLLSMYSTSFQNMFKSAALGNIKLEHRLNSVFAMKQVYIDINNFIDKGDEGVQKIVDLLQENINEMREKLVPYKKA